jgi:two-component system, NtrC family, sensor kinase
MTIHGSRPGPRTAGETTTVGTVLILDDSLTVRMDLVAAFSNAGWATVPAATAARAWELLATEPVDLIVLDVLLPDADGVEVLRELRTDPRTAALPVVMLSSEAAVKDRIRGLQTGADEYLGKPYDAAYLVARALELTHAVRPGTPEGPAGESGGPRRVLVASSSSTVRQVLQDQLETSGFEVVTAGSGLDGLRLAAGRRADAVVVDGVLPDMDGATLIRRIRLDAALRGLPCLLLTASEDVAAELRALDAGADAFVRKDADPGIVVAKLSAALRRASQASPVVDTASLQGPKKILAIGADAWLASLTDRVLSEGYDVAPARSGEEALELLAFQTTDCILLELAPGDAEAGLQMCRRIKSAPGVRDVPLILIAPEEDQHAMVEALAAGADDYVPATGDTQVLAARIRAQLRRRQLQEEHRRIRETLLHREIEATEARAAAEIAQTRAAMVEELERKNRELEAFSYSVSHDLRAPLRSIEGFTRALGDNLAEHLDEADARYLERIHAGVARMTEMIDDMLELSRIGRVQLRRNRVDLAEMAEAILADLATADPERVVEVRIGTPLIGSADPRLIRNVFENLLGNAWKFTAKTSGAIVEVGRVDGEDGSVYFVRDNGSGFDMNRAGRLFSPFQRLHSQSDFPGTGIGLATVQRIIDRHGGQVWAEADVGRGAVFRFTLPD